MDSLKTVLFEYPKWYTLEKETEKTINKLFTIKELSFYLKNSNENIRRLAILRIEELKSKESIEALKDIMNDMTENQINKELAAWAVKSISLKWDMDLFVSNKLLNKYSGAERSLPLNHVKIVDPTPQIKFEFKSLTFEQELVKDQDNIRQNEDVFLDITFSFKEWLIAILEEYKSKLRTNWKSMPRMLFIYLKTITFIIFAYLIILPFKSMTKLIKLGLNYSRIIKGKIRSGKSTSPKERKASGYNVLDRESRNSFFEKNNPEPSIKSSVFKILFFILTPLRLIIKFRKLAMFSILIIYLFFAYTSTGKILLYKYSGLELLDLQNRLFNSSKEFLGYTIDSTKELFNHKDLSSSKTLPAIKDITNSEVLPSPPPVKMFRVTAKKGLNLHTNPDLASPNVPINGLLKLNSTIKYLNESKKDNRSIIWYYVETEGGAKGWASSKYLKEVKGEKNATNTKTQ
ncbi:MAG: SH3 domain-containing protein [Bacillota bacterium]|nr:SH3 domain-containing protein [Bacillota bacterium]